jgi:hypothetical protein
MACICLPRIVIRNSQKSLMFRRHYLLSSPAFSRSLELQVTDHAGTALIHIAYLLMRIGHGSLGSTLSLVYSLVCIKDRPRSFIHSQ